MADIRVTGWNELTEALYADAWKPGLGRYRSNFAYRGMNSVHQGLQSGLVRLGSGFEQREIPLLRTFRRYAHRHIVSHDSVWNWLAVAQHHGLPTRLLDWSFSPFVAMHFATDDLDQFDADGTIWCVDYVRAREWLPKRLKQILSEEGANVFTAEMLDRGASSLLEFDRLAQGEFVVFLEPPSLDDRIVNQYALFSLMSSPAARLEDWLSEKPELYRRIVIPAGLKWEVRDKLDQANITERVLFPGLDGLSLWLRRYYTARNTDPEQGIEGRGG